MNYIEQLKKEIKVLEDLQDLHGYNGDRQTKISTLFDVIDMMNHKAQTLYIVNDSGDEKRYTCPDAAVKEFNKQKQLFIKQGKKARYYICQYESGNLIELYRDKDDTLAMSLELIKTTVNA